MIETLDDLRGVLALVREAQSRLESEGTPYRRDFKLGVLLEVPSVVRALQEIFEEVDFVSVGTNDLLQYHFAVKRTNGNINHLYRPYHPTALRLLGQIADAARAASVPVTLGGEIASDPTIVPLLYGLGYTNLSVDVHAVGAVARAVSKGADEELGLLARRCQAATTAEEVSSILHQAGMSVECMDAYRRAQAP